MRFELILYTSIVQEVWGEYKDMEEDNLRSELKFTTNETPPFASYQFARCYSWYRVSWMALCLDCNMKDYCIIKIL